MTDPAQLPRLAPSKGPATGEDVRAKRQIMQAQAEQMDFSVPLPIEENSIDYSDQVQEKTPEVKIEECKQANKSNLSAKKSATLEKARAAKKEKARIQKLEQNNIGDIMNRLIPTLNEHFEVVNRRLDDMKKIIANEAALQAQQDISNKTREYVVESKAHPKTYLIQRSEEEDEIPIEDRYNRSVAMKRKRPDSTRLDEEADYLYRRRTNQQFKYSPYETVQTETRGMDDVTTGGRTTSGGVGNERKYVMF